MSVIFGLFYRNGKPVSDELETMYAGMKRFPHETHAFIARGCCGMGHMLTYNTPEAVRESMPKRLEDAGLLFAAEGRIDNRGELFAALSIPPAEQKDMPDGDILLMAYQKWGEGCVDHLEGKWSLAAFHEKENRLFLARDKWDYTNVAYYADERVFAFASSERGLLPLPFVPRQIDELMVARLLVIWPGDYDHSYYQGIRYLLPSHAIRVSREGEQARRYWNYADIRLRQGLTLEQHTGELLDLLQRAVAVRLRSYRPIAATLSGGLDSSTVSVLAAEQMARRGERLKTYTHIPRFAPPTSLSARQFGDERPYAEAVAEASGNIDPVFLASEAISPLQGIREAVRMSGKPFHGAANAFWIADIYQTAAREGYGTLLMAPFGNATTSWSGVEDRLPAGEILRRHGAAGLLKKKALKPLLYGSTPLARLYKRAAFGRQPWNQRSYCTRAFQESLRLERRIRESGFDPTYTQWFGNPKDMAVLILDVNVLRLPFGAEFGYTTGMEFRDPTGDPRVIERALAIPNEMYAGKMNKWVLRTMMKGRLPDTVRLNEKKGKQSADIAARMYACRDEMDALLAEMETAGFGRIIDIPRLRADWEKVKADPEAKLSGHIVHMLRPIAAYELYRQAT